MHDEAAIDRLEEHGFEAFASDLPGLWATDGDTTVAIARKQLENGTIWHAYVWEGEPGDVTVTTNAVNEAVGSTPELAVNEALRPAGGDPRAVR